MSVSCIPEDVQITNEVIRDVLSEYEMDYYIDPSNVREIAGQQERPWLLVETKPGDGEVWFTLHRSLDSAKTTIAESMWETLWRPECLYNTESGGYHGISFSVEIEE